MGMVGKRSREDVEKYNANDGFVGSDDKEPREKKKSKSSGPHQNTSNQSFWELSSGRNTRRVSISEFKGIQFLNIREYYEKDGQMLPGKKWGISLTVEQYQALLDAIPRINCALQDKGFDIRGATAAQNDAHKDAMMERSKDKKDKANIEATSDEDED